MTIDELISILQDAAEEVGGDAEVRLAHQPQWPFEYSLSGQTVISKPGVDDLEEHERFMGCEEMDAEAELQRLRQIVEEGSAIVYLGEGSQLGYLPGDVKSGLGW